MSKGPVGAPARQDNFEIAGEWLTPGERRDIAIPVAHQVTGFSANLALQVLHGARSGPTVFVSAAIHGNEICGTAIIQQLIRELEPAEIAGTLILAPAVNILGFLQHDRYLPDRRDLNRSFPGSPRGSLAAQLAYCFLENVIARCSLGIDLHTAAEGRYNLPQIRIAADDPHLLELAMAFGAPVVIESPLRPGSMRALAHERGAPMLLMEGGEALRFDALAIEVGVRGVRRVLAHIGMLAPCDGFSAGAAPARANRSTWIRAPRGGVTHPLRTSGDVVHVGDLLGEVVGLFGEDAAPIISPVDGVIIGHATLPVVNQGDAVFHIAEVSGADQAGETIASITEAMRASAPEGPPQPMLDEDEVI